MSPGISTELKIPDLWFDLYARFLPGALFVSAIYLLCPGKAIVPSAWSLVILALASYCVGLFIHPISSEIVGVLHGLMARAMTGDWDFVRMQSHHDPVRILSKMHGETTFFVQSFSLSIVLLIMQKTSFFHLESTTETIEATELFLISAAIGAVDVAWRRVKRAKLLKKRSEFQSQVLTIVEH